MTRNLKRYGMMREWRKKSRKWRRNNGHQIRIIIIKECLTTVVQKLKDIWTNGLKIKLLIINNQIILLKMLIRVKRWRKNIKWRHIALYNHQENNLKRWKQKWKFPNSSPPELKHYYINIINMMTLNQKKHFKESK